MKKFSKSIQFAIVGLGVASFTDAAFASSFTRGTLPSAVTEVGGVVLDLTGLNGNRIVTEAAASTLFVGNSPSSPSFLQFGSQAGFTASILSALGGGLSSAAVRITLYDGDSQAGNFDYHQNFLYLGTSFASAANFGDFSAVSTQETDGTGTALGSLTSGFGDNILDTGFFSTTSASTLSQLYDNIVTASSGNGVLNYYLNDLSPGDQYYDFTQGIDKSLVDIGTGPIVTPPPVPLPKSFPMFGAALAVLGVCGFRRKRRSAARG